MEDGGGAPPCDPVEGALKRGGPGGGKDREGVALGGEALGAVVLGVVGHDLVDKLEEVVVLVRCRRGSGSRVELVHKVVQVGEPGLAEVSEGAHSGGLGGC